MKLLPLLLSLASISVNDSYALSNGRPVTNKNFSNVIYLHHPSNNCTAVLVNPKIALTAAHCLALRPSHGVQGNSVKRLPREELRNRIIHWKTHPSYKGIASIEDPAHPAYDNARDIGYVVFEREFSEFNEREVSELNRDSLDQNSVLTVVGFGGQRGEIVKKKSLSLRPLKRQPFHLHSFSTGPGLEGGDSGGPVFDSDHRLLGIASSSSEEPRASYFVFIHSAIEWVRQEVSR